MKQLSAIFILLLWSTTVYASPYAVSPTPNTESCISNPSICPVDTHCSGRDDGIQNDGCCPEGYELDWKSGMCATSCIDKDKDGYGLEFSLSCEYASYVDCDDTSALIHPFAYEIEGNGKDDDCNGEVDENYVPVYEDLSPRGNLSQKPTRVPGCNPKTLIDFCGDNIDNNCDSIVDESCERIDMNLSRGADAIIEFVDKNFLDWNRDKTEDVAKHYLEEGLKESKVKNAAKKANWIVQALSSLYDTAMKYAEGTFTLFWLCKDTVDNFPAASAFDETYNFIFPNKVDTVGDVMCQSLKTLKDTDYSRELLKNAKEQQLEFDQKKAQHAQNFVNGNNKGQSTYVPYRSKYETNLNAQYSTTPLMTALNENNNIYNNDTR